MSRMAARGLSPVLSFPMNSQPLLTAGTRPLSITIFERTVHGTRLNIAVREAAAGGFEASSDGKRWEPGRTQGRAIRQLIRRLGFGLRVLADFSPLWASPECRHSPRAVPIHPSTLRLARTALDRARGDVFAAR